MKRDGTKIEKLEKLIMRISVFSVLYVLPAVGMIICYFIQAGQFDQWVSTWAHKTTMDVYHSQKAIFSQLQPDQVHQQLQENGGFCFTALPGSHRCISPPNWAPGLRPSFGMFMMRYAMALVVGVTAGFWVWSSKTVTSWSNFYAKLCHHCACFACCNENRRHRELVPTQPPPPQSVPTTMLHHGVPASHQQPMAEQQRAALIVPTMSAMPAPIHGSVGMVSDDASTGATLQHSKMATTRFSDD